MKIRSVQPLVFGVGLLALGACMTPAPAAADRTSDNSVPVGVDLGPSTRVPSRVAMADATSATRRTDMARAPSSNIQPAHNGTNDAHAIGVVNRVDSTQHKINLTHEPIQALGWPSMTMDFAVAPSVDLSALKPGARVDVTLEKGKGGMYEIQSVQPVGARR
jgi:Cu/Ag efflux protein CusF